MQKPNERTEFADLRSQFDAVKVFTEIDRDGDGIVETKDIPMIMAMFGELKLPDEKFEAMKKDFDPDEKGHFDLDTFVQKIKGYIENYGTEDEVLFISKNHQKT